MTWTTPFTAVTGAVITASGWNASARDNLLHLRALLPDPAAANYWLQSSSVSGAAFVDRATAVLAALGYTPVNKAGDSMSGKLTFADNGEGIVLSGASEIRDNSGFPGLVVTAYSDALYVYDAAQSNEIFRAVKAESEPYFKSNKVWHAGNDGAGSGLDADTVDGKNPTATPAAGALPLADGSGKLDAWVTAAAGVPSGLIAAFETAAAIASGWSRYSAADGRMLVGAGATFGTTFVEATDYGSAWTFTPNGSVVIVISSHTSVKTNAQINSGGSEHVEQDHSHGISSQTFTGSTTSWVIPSRGVVWAQKS